MTSRIIPQKIIIDFNFIQNLITCIKLLSFKNYSLIVFSFQGDYIWAKQVSNGEFDIPVGGKITAIEASRVKIRDDDGKDFYVSNQQVLKTMHISSVKGVEDMINLGDLQEYAILRNLHKRYNEKLIYVSETKLLLLCNFAFDNIIIKIVEIV